MVMRYLHDHEEHGENPEEHQDREPPRVTPRRGPRLAGGGVKGRHEDEIRARRPAARTATPPAMTTYKPTPTSARTSPMGIPNCRSMSSALEGTFAMCTRAITKMTPPAMSNATLSHRSRRPSNRPIAATAATMAATTMVRPSPPFHPVSALPGGLTVATVTRSQTWNAPTMPRIAPTSAV